MPEITSGKYAKIVCECCGERKVGSSFYPNYGNQYKERLRTKDDLLSMDLRDVFKSIFHLEKVREYGDVIWCKCMFHNDNSPSFCITPTHYFCASCGAKGNIFTLIKLNLVEPPKTEYWLTPKVKELLKENNNV